MEPYDNYVRAAHLTDPANLPNATGPDDTPATVWLRQLERGDAQAAQPLYEHFCRQLQELVRQHIPANIRSAYDQEDASVSAFHSLFLGVREHRYQFADRSDFWRLLLTIAERKIANRVRYELQEKRDVRRVAQNSVFVRLPTSHAGDAGRAVESLVGREPTPEFAVEVSETCDAMLASLPDDMSREIALLKLENNTSEEIATKVGCTRRTVQRKLLVIRRKWRHAGGIEDEADGVTEGGRR